MILNSSLMKRIDKLLQEVSLYEYRFIRISTANSTRRLVIALTFQPLFFSQSIASDLNVLREFFFSLSINRLAYSWTDANARRQFILAIKRVRSTALIALYLKASALSRKIITLIIDYKYL